MSKRGAPGADTLRAEPSMPDLHPNSHSEQQMQAKGAPVAR